MATRPHAKKPGADFKPEPSPLPSPVPTPRTGTAPLTAPYTQSKEMTLALQKTDKVQKGFGGI